MRPIHRRSSNISSHWVMTAGGPAHSTAYSTYMYKKDIPFWRWLRIGAAFVLFLIAFLLSLGFTPLTGRKREARDASYSFRPMIIATQTVVKVFVLGVFFIFMAFPLIWLFYSAFKPMHEIYENVFALPKHVDITNFLHIWGSRNFPRYYMNSVLVTTTSTVGIVLLSSLAGFIFGRVRFKSRELLFMFLIAGMMIPVQVTLIPNFIFVRTMDLFDTYLAMILPYIAFNVPVSVFIMRGFFQVLPLN